MNTLWQQMTPLSEYPTLTEDLKTDAMVIGGGMTGLLIAYRLHQEGLSVV